MVDDKYKDKVKRKEYRKEYYIKNKDSILKKNKEWYIKNKDRYSEREKEWYIINKDRIKKEKEEIRNNVINHYGNKCNCCGETNLLFLTIDHVNNDGNKERQKLFGGRLGSGGTAHRMCVYIIKNNFPTDYQILCYNCNCGKSRNGGVCPHKTI